MKLFAIIITSALLLFAPTISFAQNEKPAAASPPAESLTSYDLFYPIVAGKVPGDPIYILKTIREWVVDKLVFDPIRKSDYHLILSKKRLVETEFLLLNKKDYNRAEKTIKRSVAELEKAINIAVKADEKGRKVIDLYNALSAEGQKESTFLKSLASKIPESQQKPFTEAAKDYDELVKKVDERRE